MSRNLFGWNLPPGVTDRMIDEAAGAFDDDFSDLPEEPPEEAEPSGPINTLIAEYEQWNAAQGLNLGSADEHLFDEALTDTQRAWLKDFCRRWEAAEQTERAWADAEREAFS